MMTSRDIDATLKDLQTIHFDIQNISARLVVVADWVRFKCRYGCRAYGKHLCCPPFAPTPEETRRMLSEYDCAILARFDAKPNASLLPQHTHHAMWESVTKMHRTIFELERNAFLMGFYKAFGMGALPCTLCETCVIEDKLEKNEMVHPLDTLKCRHKDIMRPSMEACGIDVFKTLANVGYSLSILKDYSNNFVLFGMVLLD